MSGLKRTDDVRRQNTHLILRVLRERATESRTGITEHTGLSPATVSTISSNLIQQSILRTQDEDRVSSSKAVRGRPQVTLSLNPRVGCVAVLSLSFYHLSAKVLDYAGVVCAEANETISTMHVSEEELTYSVTRMINQLISQGSTPGMALRYIAMGVQGVVDARARTLLWSPITALRNVPLHDVLHTAFQVPVWIANDCNMMVEALRNMYPAQFDKDFAVMLLGQGIGMGLMLKGQRFIGNQSSAGEFGHMAYQPDGALCRCGRFGCIEAYAGDYAIWRRAQQSNVNKTPDELFDPASLEPVLAKARDDELGIERQSYREAGLALGYGLRSLFALIDPVPIAFVGHGTAAIDLLEPEIRQVLGQGSTMMNGEDVDISCYQDAESLILHGCSVIALRALDEQFSSLE